VRLRPAFVSLCALVALSQAGCFGHLIAGVGSDSTSTSTFEVPPAEADGKLSCGDRPCTQVPVEQVIRRGHKRALFWPVFAAEVIVCIAGYTAFATNIGNDDASLGNTFVPLALGGTFFWAALGDVIFYGISDDYDPKPQSSRLPTVVTADWHNSRINLDVADVISVDATAPPSSFSLALAWQRRAAMADPQAQPPQQFTFHPAPGAPSVSPATPLPTGPASELHGKIAVLDLQSSAKDISEADARFFGDRVRASALRHAPQLEVITRENLIVLLQASGKDIANCEGECEVDTGRRIGADAIVSGEILKVGTRYKITLRLHETHEGRLLSATVASGSTIDELDDALGKAAADLFRRSP
jgi:hypothetical protein